MSRHLLNIALLLLVVLLLSACTSPPTVIKEPIEVQVPVIVRCKVKEVIPPVWATDAVAVVACAAATDVAEVAKCFFLRAQATVEELAQRTAYEIELRAALDECAAQSQQKQPSQPLKGKP